MGKDRENTKRVAQRSFFVVMEQFCILVVVVLHESRYRAKLHRDANLNAFEV
jgi:hypothetical protein